MSRHRSRSQHGAYRDPWWSREIGGAPMWMIIAIVATIGVVVGVVVVANLA